MTRLLSLLLHGFHTLHGLLYYRIISFRKGHFIKCILYGHIDFCIHIHRKSTFRHNNKSTDFTCSNGAASTFKRNIARTASRSYNLIRFIFQTIRKRIICSRFQHNLISQFITGRLQKINVHKAFIFFLWHPTLYQIHLVHVIQIRHNMYHFLGILRIAHSIYTIAILYRLYPLRFLKCRHIVLCKPHGTDYLHIRQFMLIKILICRQTHIRF